jgi:ATP-dependent Clp protease adaptor protein ClpS
LSTRKCNSGRIDAGRLTEARDGLTARAGGDKSPLAPRMAGKGGKKSSSDGQGTGTAVIARTKIQTQRPSMYRVLLLNDDYTPMDFVIGVLCTYFHKNFDDANRIMWQVHNNGVGECGVYTYEVADTKVTQVMEHARKHQHPLQCVMEKK